jgi:hypothetical protein
MTLRAGAIDDDFHIFVGYEFGRQTPDLVGRDIDSPRQVQLAKFLFGKRIDENDLPRVVELLLEFVPINVGDHKYNLPLDA